MTSAASIEDRRASLGHILRNALSRQSSRRPSENLQFSDLQKMATSDSTGNTEEIVLRPKLLKRQSRTESVSTPPTTPKIQLNGRAAQLLSIHGCESLDNADGKYNDLKDFPTPPVARRRSVFARLKTFVIKSHSLDDADVEENSNEDGKVNKTILTVEHIKRRLSTLPRCLKITKKSYSKNGLIFKRTKIGFSNNVSSALSTL